jgi:methyl-accepting chemotaxis protein
VEAEVELIVASAQKGDLSRRIETGNKRGFIKKLGTGINALIDQVERFFNELSEVMSVMAQGDLTQPVQGDYRGSFDDLKGNVNGTLENLRGILGQMRESMEEMRTAANEISTGNNNLSARTEQQASSLEETASSMEELTSTVRNNSDNAQQANLLATNARAKAEQGGDAVNRAVQAMNAINSASVKISEIIGVIDEIAFQTNLLALNASVEAARAGEQGRGFAVVATEVRNLAGRSATAAKEIKELIKDSEGKVHLGAKLVNESGATLEELVSAVKKVGDIIAEIASASAEQTDGIDQVNQAITSMDEMTQQNAALAEEASAAASSMSTKAGELNQLVASFRV